MDYEIIVVGGGGGCSSNHRIGRSGGGGGYTNTINAINLSANIEKIITIGAGGSAVSATAGVNGGSTSAFDNTVLGGYAGTFDGGGSGGSGGGGAGGYISGTSTPPGRGGYFGGSGVNGTGTYSAVGGAGQFASTGQTTCEFNEGTSTGCNLGITNYSCGGGGGANGSSSGITAGKGGSGIVIIRNAR